VPNGAKSLDAERIDAALRVPRIEASRRNPRDARGLDLLFGAAGIIRGSFSFLSFAMSGGAIGQRVPISQTSPAAFSNNGQRRSTSKDARHLSNDAGVGHVDLDSLVTTRPPDPGLNTDIVTPSDRHLDSIAGCVPTPRSTERSAARARHRRCSPTATRHA